MKKTLFIFTILTLLGMAAYLPFITVGSKKLTDSATYIVSSSGLKANGDIDYTGTLYNNGVPFTGGSSIDTTLIFYKSDTAGYFNRYNLDTTRFLDLSDTNNISWKSRTETLTNKTIDAANNTITSLKRGSFTLVANAKSPPIVSTNYYIGNAVLTPQTSDAICRIYTEQDIVIKSLMISIYRFGATSSQPSSAYLQVNGSDTDTLTTTWNWSAGNNNTLPITGLSRSVSAGSYISIRLLTAAWTPNVPTSFYINGSIYFEYN